MSESKDLTVEDLTDFLQHPGWRWFAQQYEKEWGESAFGLRIAAVFKTRDVAQAGPLIQQLTVARQEIDRLFAMPKQMLDGLRQAEDYKRAAGAPGRRPVGV